MPGAAVAAAGAGLTAWASLVELPVREHGGHRDDGGDQQQHRHADRPHAWIAATASAA